MLYRVIDANEIPALVTAFMESYEVIAPVRHGQGFAFDTISTPDEVVLDYNTTASSLRKYFLPPRETLLRFDARTNELIDFQQEVSPRVIFGVHACDINALNRSDLVFKDGDYADPYYTARRESTLIVGVSCTPSENCFCNVWNTDEAWFGFDLFLHVMGDFVLVTISSVEAANILEASCNVREATEEERIAFRQAARERQESFSTKAPEIHEIAMLMDVFHKDPFWEEFGGKCLSCNACASVCPTCFCFDISDVLDPDGVCGSRERTWDACTSPQFAQVAGGYNFRSSAALRVRHRMYHKMNGFLANYDRVLCVGCGRCVSACKADINPIRVLEFFNTKGVQES